MVVGCLDHHWLADSDGGALLRRVGRNDAEGRRAICLFARSFLAAVGFPLRLDIVPRDSDRNDRGGRGRLRKVSRCHLAEDFHR